MSETESSGGTDPFLEAWMEGLEGLEGQGLWGYSFSISLRLIVLD
jgi:hypothetical protein